MASIIYNNFIVQLPSAVWDLDGTPSANVGVMLVTAAYTPNVNTHIDRADVTNEVSGTGYATKIDLSASKSTGSNTVIITLPGTTWDTATITAAGAVYFLDTGAAANDLLIAYNDFGGDISSTAATFTLNSSDITITNNSAA